MSLYGNAIVGQSGGPTAAINATLAGVIKGALAAQKNGQIGTLYGMRNGVEGLLAERLIDLGKEFEDESRLSILVNTPSSALGSCRKKLPPPEKDESVYAEILRIFKKYDIRYFFYIGGNDSMDTVDKLSAYFAKNQYEAKIVGVPKTIDNDLVVTDHTPGFGSAAKYVAVTMQEILRDCAVYTIPAVTIVEIMGRDAGWLTTAAALPGADGGIGPDLVYLPEKNFDLEAFFADVRAALDRHPNVVVAISEGIHDANGKYVGEGLTGGVDAFGHTQLSGAGKVLEVAVKEKFGCKVRSIELNLPQRCAAHLASAADLSESVAAGEHAVKAALAGESGCMVTMIRSDAPYNITYGISPVSAIANQVKHVPDAYINERANGVTDACIAYLRPLICGEATPLYKDGLPVHCIL